MTRYSSKCVQNGCRPPALGLAEPDVDIRGDAHQTEDARIESQVPFEEAGAVYEQRLLDGDARQASATRESQALQKLRRRWEFTFHGIWKVLDEHVLGHEPRQMPCATRVHKWVDHEHRHPVPEALGGPGGQWQPGGGAVFCPVRRRGPCVPPKRGEV